MRPWAAWGTLLALAALNGLALVAPWPAVVAAAMAAFLVLRRGRLGFLAFAALTLLINTFLLAWLVPGPTTVALGPLGLGREGAWLGFVGGLRLVAVVGVNLTFFSWIAPARLLDGLRLPRRATGFLAAVLIASQDIGRDFRRLQDARRLDGGAPEGRWQRVRRSATLMAPLLVAAHRRAKVRRDALQVAGISMGPRFAPVVAVTALAVAGRLAFVAVPNVSLTYVFVFVGGVAFGPWVGLWAGLWSMALTDFLLSGLLVSAYANAPAMALVGAMGGWLGRSRLLDLERGGRAVAASAGIVATFLFSVLADLLTWAVVPEFRVSLALLQVRVVAGLAFNAVPALTNAGLFAVAVGPVERAFRALRRGGPVQDGEDVQGGP